MMNDNLKEQVIIGILTVLGVFAVFSNAANATTVKPAATNLISEQVQPSPAPYGAFLVSKTSSPKNLQKYINKETLTDKELKDLLYQVGFRGRALREAWAIAKRETNGRPYAFNGNGKTGDKSYGLFQINMLRDLGPDRREFFGLYSNAELFNPVLNAQIAYYMSNHGSNWSSWHGMNKKAREWLLKFPK